MVKIERNPSWWAAAIVLWVAAGVPAAGREAPEQPPAAVAGGVVIERLVDGAPLHQAGLRLGDRLVRWQRLGGPETGAAARGELGSVFDWHWLELEEVPRGAIRLEGFRDGAPVSFEVPTGDWSAAVRPPLEAARLADFEEGARLIEGGEAAAGIALWERVAAATEAAAERCWLAVKTARAWASAGEQERAAASFAVALAAAEGPLAKAQVWEETGRVRLLQNDVEGTRRAFTEAMEIRRRTWGEGLSYAKSLGGLAQLAWMTGDLDEIARLSGEALEILGRLAPGSLDEASTSDALAAVAWRRGDMDRAEALFESALEIRERLVPGGLSTASSLNNLGLLAYTRGDFARAADLHARALAIRQRLDADSLDHAESLNNLGLLSVGRGRLEEAEEHYRRTLELVDRLAPGSIFAAYTLNNLGGVAMMRGELEAAEEFHRAALEIRQQVSPESHETADILSNLGGVAWRRGELDRAAAYHRQALAIREAMALDGLPVAESLNNLGTTLRDAGDLAAAAELYDRALAIRQAQAPGSLVQAKTLLNRGVLADLEGDRERAEALARRAVEIQEAVAPGSWHVASTRQFLGRLAADAGRPQDALDHLAAGMTAIEEQIGKLGGSQEVKGDFRAAFAGLYRQAIELELELGRPAGAFLTLERWRSRNFLNLLAERDLVLSAGEVPAELVEARRGLARRQDQIHKRMSGLSATDAGEELDQLRGELRSLLRERASLAARVRRASPRLAALQYPEPLSAAAAAAALDPGTVMLSYSVGESATDLFVLAAGGELAVERLAIGRAELAEQVERFRNLILESRVEAMGGVERRGLERLASHLYDTLVAPAAALEEARRVVIVADGPLHLLPFAALRRGAAEPAYLVEWKPLHTTASATVYAASRRPRRHDPAAGAPNLLVAFGDPRLPGPAAAGDALPADAQLRSVVERGLFDFRPLPYSRAEVEAIAALWGDQPVRAFLGDQATEERVKSAGGEARILHLATHGSVDERFPLNSALVLSIPQDPAPGQDNGLLQAWEVFEQLRLEADLVVLSGCATGLGRSVRGEGLLGLTRAFQYAGADSVVASLWNVSDRATAELMRRFYAGLKQGEPIDRALRAAQLELIRTPLGNAAGGGLDVSAPYYWAAFQIYGDWR